MDVDEFEHCLQNYLVQLAVFRIPMHYLGSCGCTVLSSCVRSCCSFAEEFVGLSGLGGLKGS